MYLTPLRNYLKEGIQLYLYKVRNFLMSPYEWDELWRDHMTDDWRKHAYDKMKEGAGKWIKQ